MIFVRVFVLSGIMAIISDDAAQWTTMLETIQIQCLDESVALKHLTISGPRAVKGITYMIGQNIIVRLRLKPSRQQHPNFESQCPTLMLETLHVRNSKMTTTKAVQILSIANLNRIAEFNARNKK